MNTWCFWVFSWPLIGENLFPTPPVYNVAPVKDLSRRTVVCMLTYVFTYSHSWVTDDFSSAHFLEKICFSLSSKRLIFFSSFCYDILLKIIFSFLFELQSDWIGNRQLCQNSGLFIECMKAMFLNFWQSNSWFNSNSKGCFPSDFVEC